MFTITSEIMFRDLHIQHRQWKKVASTYKLGLFSFI